MRTDLLKLLDDIKSLGSDSACKGIANEYLASFLSTDSLLERAIVDAHKRALEIRDTNPEYLRHGENELRHFLQDHLLNFYGPQSVSPFVPLAACGPWIVSVSGAVIYDAGGYGMLGFGHNPSFLEPVLKKEQVMANIMTGSFALKRALTRLRDNIGIKCKTCPYEQFLFMNSGSESMEVARRMADVRVKELTAPGEKFHGYRVKSLTLNRSFHGRTTLAAQVSHSSRKYYQALASFEHLDNLVVVPPNDIKALEQAFHDAHTSNCFIEGCYMEPVMGEGNPGLALTPEFYNAARELSKKYDSLLIIDSIQAGLRAHGVLSIVDYPGFESCDAPDAETFSKALNAGQYPLSVLAVSAKLGSYYRKGIYGNTMTGNPRAADITTEVLGQCDTALRANIEQQGQYFRSKLQELQQKFPQELGNAQGTGLLLSLEVKSRPVTGEGGIEELLRLRGINVIHGGQNSLRFTPWFKISTAEIDLICNAIADIFS